MSKNRCPSGSWNIGLKNAGSTIVMNTDTATGLQLRACMRVVAHEVAHALQDVIGPATHAHADAKHGMQQRQLFEVIWARGHGQRLIQVGAGMHGRQGAIQHAAQRHGHGFGGALESHRQAVAHAGHADHAVEEIRQLRQQLLLLLLDAAAQPQPHQRAIQAQHQRHGQCAADAPPRHQREQHAATGDDGIDGAVRRQVGAHQQAIRPLKQRALALARQARRHGSPLGRRMGNEALLDVLHALPVLQAQRAAPPQLDGAGE